jgi:hypothetical protein
VSLGKLPPTEDSTLFSIGVGTLGISVAVNIVVVVGIYRYALRHELFEMVAAHEDLPLMVLVLVLAATNLEALVLLPWTLPPAVLKAGGYGGFPTRWLMLVTILSVLFEDIPQICVQGVNAKRSYIEQGIPVPAVVYMTLMASGGNIVLQLVKKYVSYTLKDANATVRRLVSVAPGARALAVQPGEIVTRQSHVGQLEEAEETAEARSAADAARIKELEEENEELKKTNKAESVAAATAREVAVARIAQIQAQCSCSRQRPRRTSAIALPRQLAAVAVTTARSAARIASGGAQKMLQSVRTRARVVPPGAPPPGLARWRNDEHSTAHAAGGAADDGDC